jgi:hypothetical protein
MPKYNKVYFLHIPKTGGRFLIKYILRPMENILKDNGIELVKSPEDVRQHAGWPSWIDDQTYVIAVFREPCEFFVSSVCHAVAGKRGLIDQEKWYIIKEEGKDLRVDKQELYDTLLLWEYMKDFQSQNFVLSPDPETKSILHESKMQYENKIVLNKKEVYDKVNRTNLMIRNKDLRSMDYSLLVNKISEDLGVKINLDFSQIDKEYFKNSASEFLFNTLTQEDKDYINQNFMIDKEIYENDSLFWNPKNLGGCGVAT